ncbi:MAG: COX15/CtaA family protein [Nannocystaceae bacterium]
MPSTRITRFAWGLLAYTIFVILFGAWVRITGSGAGCGEHWPTCHGEIVPRAPEIETIIEFTHRLTSGVYGILVVLLLIAVIRRFPRGHLARLTAWLTLLFTISEALVGARLVLLGLVADNDSVDRAIWMAIHLINTSFLTGSLAACCWSSGQTQSPRRVDKRTFWISIGALVGLGVVGVSGAVTALGDTLYPVLEGGAGLVERVANDQALGAHFLQKVRILHPMIAVGVGALLLGASQILAGWYPSKNVEALARWVSYGVVLQITAGVVNIMLSAPGWMQIIHLLCGTMLWIGVVLLVLAVRYPSQAR